MISPLSKTLAFFLLLDLVICAGGFGLGWYLGQRVGYGAGFGAGRTAEVQEMQVKFQEIQAKVADRPEVAVAADNLSLLGERMRAYNETHLYIQDVYDCSDMAADVWDMAVAAGFHAFILVGNPYEEGKRNHAWVVAEVEPGQWVALEGTNGGIYNTTTFMKGRVFDDPALFMKYYTEDGSLGWNASFSPFTGNGSAWLWTLGSAGE